MALSFSSIIAKVSKKQNDLSIHITDLGSWLCSIVTEDFEASLRF